MPWSFHSIQTKLLPVPQQQKHQTTHVKTLSPPAKKHERY